MKNGAKLFYAIGFVFNVLSIIIIAVLLGIFGFSYSQPELLEQMATEIGVTAEFIKEAILAFIILLAIGVAIEFIITFVVVWARRNLIRNTGRVSPHVILLILGIVGLNIFYLLGGIFGMTAASNDSEDEDVDNEQ